MKIATDHGWPTASDGSDFKEAWAAFKNERDYIAQSGKFKTTVAALDWAAREIERLRSVALVAMLSAGHSQAEIQQVLNQD